MKELLAVLLIVGALVVVLVPAIQSLRESSRQNHCAQNLTTIGLALADYSVTFFQYPAGSINPSGPIHNRAEGFHHNWIEGILPSLDYLEVYEMIDPSVSVYAPANADAMQVQLPILRCPSATGVPDKASSYAGVHHPTETPIDVDNRGMFILNRPLSQDEVPDGLGTTLLVGEKLDSAAIVRDAPELGWLSGTRATLRNLGHPLGGPGAIVVPEEEVSEWFVGGFASAHPDGVIFLHGDGSVRTLAPSADLRVLQQLADRRNGPTPEEVNLVPDPM